MTVSFRHPPTILHGMSAAYRIREWLRLRRPDYRRAKAERTRFYTATWKEAAASLGARVQTLDDEILEICAEGRCTRVRQNTTAIDDPVTLATAGNKPLVHRLLAQRGLAIPKYLVFSLSEIDKAIAFLERTGAPCVIKPANSGGGFGVTANIVRTTGLIRAATAAAIYGPTLLIEQQIEGDVYRLLYLDGALLDAIMRRPPVVVGDGRSTIRELVELENRNRETEGAKLAHVLVSIDLDMVNSLSRQALSLTSVPASGAVVTVKAVVNQNSREGNVPAKHLLCDSIVTDGAVAAATVGARFAGIDIITTDPGKPLSQTGGVILEVNTTPAFHQHYFRQGEKCDVATVVLRRLLLGVPRKATTTPLQLIPSSALVRAR